jgi:hypothetical protein
MTILNSPVYVRRPFACCRRQRRSNPDPALAAVIFFIFLQVPYDSESLQFIAETRGQPLAAALAQQAPAGAHFRSCPAADCSAPVILSDSD